MINPETYAASQQAAHAAFGLALWSAVIFIIMFRGVIGREYGGEQLSIKNRFISLIGGMVGYLVPALLVMWSPEISFHEIWQVRDAGFHGQLIWALNTTFFFSPLLAVIALIGIALQRRREKKSRQMILSRSI